LRERTGKVGKVGKAGAAPTPKLLGFTDHGACGKTTLNFINFN